MFIKIRNFFRRYFIFILLAAVSSGLIVLRLSQRGQPPGVQPSLVPQPSLIRPKITGIQVPPGGKLLITDFSFPSNLEIYQGKESKLSSDKTIKIAQEFNFSQPPQESEDVFLGTFYAWSSETHFLSIALDVNKIEYGLDLYRGQPSTQGPLPSLEEARVSLENLLAKLGLTPQFEIKWQKEEYLIQGLYFLPTNNLEEADFIKIGFNPAVGQYQLVGLNPNEPLVSLILAKGGDIIRFQYQIFFSGFEKQETYDLKNKEEIQTTLTTEGKIVYAGTFKETTKEPKITQAIFSQIKLAYFQEPEKSLTIHPIFILSGQGTLAGGEVTEIIVYLPAISSKWLKPVQEHFRL